MVSVQVQNTGGVDATDVTVSLLANNGGQLDPLDAYTLDIPAETLSKGLLSGCHTGSWARTVCRLWSTPKTVSSSAMRAITCLRGLTSVPNEALRPQMSLVGSSHPTSFVVSCFVRDGYIASFRAALCPFLPRQAAWLGCALPRGLLCLFDNQRSVRLDGYRVPTARPFGVRSLGASRRSPLRRERFELSDGDFVDLDWLVGGQGPIVVILHGLGGSSDSPYVRGC